MTLSATVSVAVAGLANNVAILRTSGNVYNSYNAETAKIRDSSVQIQRIKIRPSLKYKYLVPEM